MVPTAPSVATEGAPEGISWPGREVVPAQCSPRLEGLEEQAGGMPVVCRGLEGSRQEPEGAQQWEGAQPDSRQSLAQSKVLEGSPTIQEGARISREGTTSTAEGPQFREGFPRGRAQLLFQGSGRRHPADAAISVGSYPV